jgi:hypothetical protein
LVARPHARILSAQLARRRPSGPHRAKSSSPPPHRTKSTTQFLPSLPLPYGGCQRRRQVQHETISMAVGERRGRRQSRGRLQPHRSPPKISTMVGGMGVGSLGRLLPGWSPRKINAKADNMAVVRCVRLLPLVPSQNQYQGRRVRWKWGANLRPKLTQWVTG